MSYYSMILSDGLNDPSNTIQLALIITLAINIGIEIFKFITMLILAGKEKKNKKFLLIEEKRIKILEELFQSMDFLSLYGKDETVEMLSEIKKISLFVTKNKLYIPKKFQKIANEILDYFRKVMTDYRQKDISQETKLFEKFCNEFNK